MALADSNSHFILLLQLRWQLFVNCYAPSQPSH